MKNLTIADGIFCSNDGRLVIGKNYVKHSNGYLCSHCAFGLKEGSNSIEKASV